MNNVGTRARKGKGTKGVRVVVRLGSKGKGTKGVRVRRAGKGKGTKNSRRVRR